MVESLLSDDNCAMKNMRLQQMHWGFKFSIFICQEKKEHLLLVTRDDE
jgi:hypothetical protein